MKKMRILIFILITISLSSCTLKPVETVYYEEKDLTRFKCKTFKDEIGGGRINYLYSRNVC